MAVTALQTCGNPSAVSTNFFESSYTQTGTEIHSDYQTYSVINPSIPGNRLYQNASGEIVLISKSPAEVVGELVLRPLIDRVYTYGAMFFNKVSPSFFSMYQYMQSACKSIDHTFSFPVAEAATLSSKDAKEFVDKIKEGIEHYDKVTETIDAIVQHKPVEEDQSLWEKIKNVISVIKEPTSWYETLVQEGLERNVANKLYDLNDKYQKYNAEINAYLKQREKQDKIKETRNLITKTEKEIQDCTNEIDRLQTEIDDIEREGIKCRADFNEAKKFHDEAQERLTEYHEVVNDLAVERVKQKCVEWNWQQSWCTYQLKIAAEALINIKPAMERENINVEIHENNMNKEREKGNKLRGDLLPKIAKQGQYKTRKQVLEDDLSKYKLKNSQLKDEL
ncbi:MAG: hypothetical protein ACHQT8_04790 [Chlamydiales bacterium]